MRAVTLEQLDRQLADIRRRRLEQLAAFVAHENAQQPHRTHIAAWALQELLRLQAAPGAALLFDDVDAVRVVEAAGEEIWHNLRKWGDPSQRDNHTLDCGCTYCN